MGRPHTLSTHSHRRKYVRKYKMLKKYVYYCAHTVCYRPCCRCCRRFRCVCSASHTHTRAGYEFVKNFSRDGRGIDLQSCWNLVIDLSVFFFWETNQRSLFVLGLVSLILLLILLAIFVPCKEDENNEVRVIKEIVLWFFWWFVFTFQQWNRQHRISSSSSSSWRYVCK